MLKGPRKCIHALEKELTEVRRGPLTANSVSMEKELLLKIELLLKQEEIQWIQRGRANWLCHGDRNTKNPIIFPQHEGRRILYIKHLIYEGGNKLDDTDSMGNLIHNYFKGLFTSEVAHQDGTVLDQVPSKVTAGMNSVLLVPSTAEEVKK